MAAFPITDRNRVRRLPDRGRYDAATVHAIIDAAMVCHVGFVDGDLPFVIPMLHARRNDELLVHGASSSRLLRHIAQGHPLSVTITILDGLVLAKSAFNQSVNYRSAILFGRGRLLVDITEKLAALEAFTERMVPGQWQHVRRPNDQELKATSIVAIAIEDASAKIRSGPSKDDDEDRALPGWAGVIPIAQMLGAPVPADYSSVPVPHHVEAHIARGGGAPPVDDQP